MVQTPRKWVLHLDTQIQTHRFPGCLLEKGKILISIFYSVITYSFAPSVALADPPTCVGPQCSIQLTPEAAFAAAQKFADEGNVQDSVQILKLLTHDRKAEFRAEALVRIARLLEEKQDFTGAIFWFRQLLAENPSAVAVRLELARAFYLAKDYDNAERQIRFVMASDLSPSVTREMDQFLYKIRMERGWSYNLSVAAAPDTNLNAGPSIRNVEIFGLPFQLSDNARRQSGVGASIVHSLPLLLARRLASRSPVRSGSPL